MIEAKGDITINQWESGDNLRTQIRVDVEHSDHHDLLIDNLVGQVAVIIKTIDTKPCMHLNAFVPREGDEPRQKYCILCGYRPKARASNKEVTAAEMEELVEAGEKIMAAEKAVGTQEPEGDDPEEES